MVGLDGQFCVTGAPGMRPKCDCVQKKKGNSISLSHLFISVKIDIHIYTESERASERVCVCVCALARARNCTCCMPGTYQYFRCICTGSKGRTHLTPS